TYLLSYNTLSALLWFSILSRVLSLLSVWGNGAYRGTVYGEMGAWVRAVQTLAVVEVGHSLGGIVRAPLFTTLMQVASRILLVWGICYPFPLVPASSPAYSTMLIAWSATEVVRYGYFAFVLARGSGGVPGVLTWLRYNTFFILYPLGISSECWLIYKASEPASKLNPLYAYACYAVLAVYVPGSYILYTHMMAQRRRIMRGKAKA
ncbi:PTPLA-domain-containing protein, partial [Aulographum hederae CBS 113979]